MYMFFYMQTEKCKISETPATNTKVRKM